MAKKAVEEYEKAEQEEKEGLDNLEREIDRITINVGAFVTGYEPDEGTCTIGAETSGVPASEYGKNGIKANGDQEFTTEDMQWRIWDYDGTTLTIISSKPTQDTLCLSDATGYNNGVYAVNEIIRKCYTQQGLKDITVRNLRRTDIQKVSTYDYTNYKHKEGDFYEATDSTTENLIQFGEKTTFDTYHKSPIMWKNFDSRWDYEYSEGTKTGDKECEIWEEENGYTNELGTDAGDAATEFKQSYYRHTYSEDEFINKQYYDMIFKVVGSSNKSYYLAGRYVCLNNFDYCSFGLSHAGSVSVDGVGLCSSAGSSYIQTFALRPLVSIDLESNNLKLVEKSGETKSYEIKIKR